MGMVVHIHFQIKNLYKQLGNPSTTIRGQKNKKIMKKLKDYIHFYLGCECLIGDKKEIDYIQMVNETGLSVCTGTNKNDIQLWYKTSSCKPILRPLSDMTEEENKEAMKMYYVDDVELLPWFSKQHFELTRWLLSKHFDIFGLITDGIAIDKTTYK